MIPAPEMLALAREIAASAHEQAHCHDVAAMIRHGQIDHDLSVQSALAAIQRTTELAAKFIEKFGSADSIGSYEDASNLRNFEHLKGAV